MGVVGDYVDCFPDEVVGREVGFPNFLGFLGEIFPLVGNSIREFGDGGGTACM